MKKGLVSKLAATFIVIISVSFIMTAAFLSYWFEGYYFEQRKTQLMSDSQLIATAAVQYIDEKITADKFNDALVYVGKYLSANIWLTDNYGIVYAVSDNEHKNILGKQVLTNDLEQLRENHVVESRGKYGKLITAPVHTIEIPIFHNEMFKGVIIMHSSLSEISGALKRVYEIIWISAIFAIMVSCIVIYYISRKIIINPLAQINYVADKISKGEVDRRVKINSKDEIGVLAKSFNSMADSLEKVEKNRREFISNVSHEIRSPITSIKGFIGGILDGVIPKEKENYYLSMTYEEIQRLTRLVNDLLDLSSIEAGQFKLRIEEIDINEIIRLCVIKFETKIKEKKLTVDVLMQDDKLLVVGDRDRITQVVTNLTDNAIKYVNEGGNVKISTKAKGEKVIVSIFNDGPGISEEGLKHIWDRFYKEDKSRTSKVSTGLGLPIVRCILTQLGEDIWAENQQPQGVTFTFTLKRI
ncbi:histidine kinase [Clostridium carboxidivorans P7]|uniref:histidine kinase n=1 Tax=Clostridium carboxidivorans P7 TaxID=536227 RepID=C6PQD1_9CLOT|nr:HAMP domain-containing sensor histidine kinase [Clostridium carboxidivorans]AKN33038.1 histidine kinase [Clostridium carboxidivorans P7]EET88601.1 histidine kinase [Clostridium carboxidivorans P7]EFG88040.1 ATPase, histidine kinase-, DNA gyrase B-, and HSP90-like domain protein [Clostridium carboxidivorans P7]